MSASQYREVSSAVQCCSLASVPPGHSQEVPHSEQAVCLLACCSVRTRGRKEGSMRANEAETALQLPQLESFRKRALAWLTN